VAEGTGEWVAEGTMVGFAVGVLVRSAVTVAAATAEGSGTAVDATTAAAEVLSASLVMYR
jgi:hypothetical protein